MDLLEESVSRLRLWKLSVEEVHKMIWQDLEDKIERWIKASNVALKILFPSERRFYDRVFFRFSSTANFSFMEVYRGTTIQLLNFVDVVRIGSHSLEWLFRILDVFETLRDPISEFESWFSNQYNVSLRNITIRGILIELENLIHHDPTKIVVPDDGLYPITRYVMNYLRAACRYIVQKTKDSELGAFLRDNWI
ncbi:hypothetical protein RJT34_16922 [Clitoria ternatea]|uniref:Exocyst subunit Exo70 family protein n=1 Tax=Clitoria ternatea TaxID=43366 RepID=A0AAN9JB47_CLITE